MSESSVMAQGRIIKGIGGFYYVQTTEGQIVECRARGRFRLDGKPPLVGDMVTVLAQRDGYALIDEILPRKNVLLRPQAANIDRLVIVLSASAPAPDWLLADKLIIQAMASAIQPLLLLNKCDEMVASVQSAFRADYANFETLCVSAKTGSGMPELQGILENGVSCFAGQSAVGKTSLLNALIPGISRETGGLSRKTERGRHTTRHAELIPFGDGAILDTPGFSFYEQETLEQDALNACYPEFDSLPKRCRFAGCMHLSEPLCAVKDMVERGGMSAGRYERYAQLAKEFEQRRKHKYD